MRIRQNSLRFMQKVFICFLIQAFLLSQAAFALNADEKYQKQKKLQQDNQSESSEINLAQAEVVTTGYSGLATQGYGSKANNVESTVDFESIADELGEMSLEDKAMVLKAAGASESEAATALLRQGDDTVEVKNVMVEAGFDTQKIGAFLDNVIEKQNNAQTTQDLPNISETALQITEDAADLNTQAVNFDDFLNLSADEQSQMWNDLTQGEQEAVVSLMKNGAKRDLFLALGGESSGLMEFFGLKKFRGKMTVDDSLFTKADVDNVSSWIQASADYMSDLGYDVHLPSEINLGDFNGKNSGSSEVWNLSSTDPSVITNKVASTILREEYPDLGYVGNETFSRVFNDQILQENGEPGMESGETDIYNTAFEGLDNNTMSQAYSDLANGNITQAEFETIAENVANNPRALFQSIRDVISELGSEAGNELVAEALNNLQDVSNPGAQEILNAFVQADEEISAGANTSLIEQSFDAHGISSVQTYSVNNLTAQQQESSKTTDTADMEPVSYQSLADEGLTDTQIVSQLKAEGASATDILKSATALDRDMVSVAGAMQEAGFSNADIATAYIAKASGWAVDATVNVVNCAVQSLAEVLTGTADIGSSVVELAYEVIVNDIMQTGEVIIENGDIMSSMLAIKDVAAEHGVELNGYNLNMSDLEGLNDAAIVHLDGNHWVTVTNIEGDTVTVMDNGKEKTMSLDTFESRWDGNSLVVNDETLNEGQLFDPQMRGIRGGRDSDGGDSGGNNNTDTDTSTDYSGGWEGQVADGHADAVDNSYGGAQPSDNSDQANGDYGSPNDGLNSLQSAGNNLSDWGEEHGGFLGGLAQMAGSAMSGIGNLGSSIGSAMSDFADATGLSTAWGYAKEALSTVTGLVHNAATKIGAVIDTAFNIVASPFKGIGNQLDQWGKSLSAWGEKRGGILGGLAKAGGSLLSGAGTLSTGIGTAIDGYGDLLESALTMTTGLIDVAFGDGTMADLEAQVEAGIDINKDVDPNVQVTKIGPNGIVDPTKKTKGFVMGFGQMTPEYTKALTNMATNLDVNIAAISYEKFANMDNIAEELGIEMVDLATNTENFDGFVSHSFGAVAAREAWGSLSTEQQTSMLESVDYGTVMTEVSPVTGGNSMANLGQNAGAPIGGAISEAFGGPNVGNVTSSMSYSNAAASNMDTYSNAYNGHFNTAVDPNDTHYSQFDDDIQNNYNNIMNHPNTNTNFTGGHTGILDTPELQDYINQN